MHFIALFSFFSLLFFFNDPATTEIYTLSLHDALPIWGPYEITGTLYQAALERVAELRSGQLKYVENDHGHRERGEDRKSTRLNSSHVEISYAVFCLKKKKKNHKQTQHTPKR